MKNKGIKKIFAALLAAAVALSLSVPAFALPKENGAQVYLNGVSGQDSNDGTTAQQAVRTLQKALELAGDGGTILVTGYVMLEDAGEITLNNVTIKRDVSYGRSGSGLSRIQMLWLRGDTTLTLGEGAILDGGNTGEGSPIIQIEASGSGNTILNIGPGAVLQNNKYTAVSVRGTSDAAKGIVNMTGGAIQNNEGDASGDAAAAVNIGNYGVFYLRGGEIKDNYTEGWGPGGMEIGSGGSLYMSGGSIKNNETLEGGGGLLNYYGYAELTGGRIEGNTAYYGGGIAMLGPATTVLDGTVIAGNRTDGNGAAVYLEGLSSGECRFIMKSGSITGNTTTDGDGAGIYGWANSRPTVIEIQGGTISGNTTQWSGEAVYLGGREGYTAAATLELSGSPQIAGDVFLNDDLFPDAKVDIIGEFTPVQPVEIDDTSWTDYRTVAVYAAGLTPNMQHFTTDPQRINNGLILDGQEIKSINLKTVIIREKDGSVNYGNLQVLPDTRIDPAKLPSIARKGYTLKGFQKSTGEEWNLETDIVSESMILYPLWKLDPATFTLTADKESVHVTPVEGGEVTLTAAVSPHAASNITYTWQWYRGSELIAEGKNNETLTVTQAGTYKVVVTADDGRQFSDPKELSIVISEEGHIYPDEWESDETHHWKECTVCGHEDAKTVHAGGTATCKDQAVCTDCGRAYGALDSENHVGGTQVRNASAASCTVDGYTGDIYCLGCGEKIASGTAIPALDHDMGEWETVTSPDCTNKGSEQRKCSRCDYIETRDLDPMGHTWEADFTVDKEPTCTEDGSKSIHCEKCDAVKDSTVIPATGHSFTNYVSNDDATCTQDGTETANCDNGCGAADTRTRTDSALGHDMGEWETVTSPDCTNKGSEQRKCSRCDYTETRDLDPIGHTWEADFTVDKEPTCTEDGSQSIHCEKCDAVKDNTVIPATGHSFGTAWQMDGENHWNTCTICGATGNQAGHIFTWVTDKEATAEENGSKHEECTVCGYQKAAVEMPAAGGGTTTPDDPDSVTENPKTGEGRHFVLWGALLLISGTLAGILAIAVKRKQKHN